ncbi:MAG: branched-chain amino acid ABC transporter permease [Planctomycetes bacterium]|nr:branched-chain amino acid ABC transporter permease [Planctomycetota bacterium]
MEEFVAHLLNACTLGAIYALIAVGYTMVYGIIKLINFAHGEIYMTGAMLAWWFVTSLGAPLLLATAMSMAGCALVGALLDRVAYRPLRKSGRLAALITALGMSLSLQTLAQLVFGARPKAFPDESIPPFFTSGWKVFGTTLYGKDVAIWAAAAASMAGLDLLVRRTRTGKAMRACSMDPAMAALMGIEVNRVITLTFMIGSSLAAVAGVLYALKVGGNIEPRMGYYAGLLAFAAAVLGGIGNLRGAMLGGLLIGMTQALFAGFVSSQYDFAFAFAVMILVILVRPFGLLGQPEAQRA